MSPLDKQIIARKAKLIHKDLEKLAEYRELSLKEYEENYDYQLLVERLIELIVGRLLDINYHILSQRFGQPPDDYRQSFVLMGRLGAVDNILAQKIADCAGLRNILAHDYDEIDHKIVYESINLVLELTPEYVKACLESIQN